jgi:hypothetical protein
MQPHDGKDSKNQPEAKAATPETKEAIDKT